MQEYYLKKIPFNLANAAYPDGKDDEYASSCKKKDGNKKHVQFLRISLRGHVCLFVGPSVGPVLFITSWFLHFGTAPAKSQILES